MPRLLLRLMHGFSALGVALAAQASFLSLDRMDSMSWGVAWFVIIVMPIPARRAGTAARAPEP